MIEQRPSANTKDTMRQNLPKGLAVFSVVHLAGVGIALGLFFGTKIESGQWALLVAASGLATYIVIALVDARTALLVWIITAPFARFVYLNVDLGRGIPNLTLNRVMTAFLVVLLLAQLAGRRRKMAKITVADILLAAFCGAMALSVQHAIVGIKSGAQSFFDLIVIPVVVYFLARNLITSRKDLKAVIYSLLIVGFYLAVLAIHEQVTGVVWFYPEDRSVRYTRSIRRVVALLGNPAYIAVSIGMAVPWAWYLFLNARHHRSRYLFIVLVMMAGVYFCMNRSGWVGLVAALLVMALFIKRFRGIVLTMLLLGVIVGGVYWAIIISSATVQERLTAQGPIEYRMQTWKVALGMIKDHGVFGLGWDNFRYYYKQYAYWDIYLRAMPTPHNTYLWVILTAGIAAFIPFVTFLLSIFFSALRVLVRGISEATASVDAELAGTFLASMVVILAPAMVMDVLTGYYNTMLMFLIMGAFSGFVTGEGRRLREEKRRQAALART